MKIIRLWREAKERVAEKNRREQERMARESKAWLKGVMANIPILPSTPPKK